MSESTHKAVNYFQNAIKATSIHSASTDTAVHSSSPSRIFKDEVPHKNQISRCSFSPNKPLLPLSPVDIPPSQYSPHNLSSINTFFLQAYLAYDTKDYPTAIRLYSKILLLDPLDLQTHINIGVVYYHLKLIDQSIQCFEKAVKIDSKNPLGYINTAVAFAMAGKCKKVVEIFEKAEKELLSVPDQLTKAKTYAILVYGKVAPALKAVEISKDRNRRQISAVVLTAKHSTPVRSQKKLWVKKDLYEVVDSGIRLVTVSEDKKSFSPASFIRKKSQSIDLQPKQKIATRVKKFRVVKKINEPKYELNEYIKESNRKLLKVKKICKEQLPGFYQKDVSELNAKDNGLENEEKQKFIDEELQNLKRSIEEHIILGLKEMPEVQIPEVTSDKLTEQQLEFLLAQFDSPSSCRSYSEIDSLLGSLEFFCKYSFELRQSLYQISKIAYYRPQQTIFNQGDIGENLYIIIKGSVSIVKASSDFRGYSIPINSIYDGKHFGDIALINALNSNPLTKRTASCISCESTYLLTISKLKYQELLLKIQLNDIEEKALFLSKIAIFRNVSPVKLIALAYNIGIKSFNLNETITEKGEAPKGLYVLYSGQVALLTQGYAVKSIGPYSSARLKAKKTKIIQVNKNLHRSEDFSSQLPREAIQKFFSQKKAKRLGPGQSVIQDQLPFAILRRGDFWGGRSLLDETISEKPSKFSVIAKSLCVEVMMIAKCDLFYIPEETLEQIKTILSRSYEIDCPDDVDPVEMDAAFTLWQDYKNECVENARQDKYFERHKF